MLRYLLDNPIIFTIVITIGIIGIAIIISILLNVSGLFDDCEIPKGHWGMCGRCPIFIPEEDDEDDPDWEEDEDEEDD